MPNRERLNGCFISVLVFRPAMTVAFTGLIRGRVLNLAQKVINAHLLLPAAVKRA